MCSECAQDTKKIYDERQGHYACLKCSTPFRSDVVMLPSGPEYALQVAEALSNASYSFSKWMTTFNEVKGWCKECCHELSNYSNHSQPLVKTWVDYHQWVCNDLLSQMTQLESVPRQWTSALSAILNIKDITHQLAALNSLKLSLPQLDYSFCQPSQLVVARDGKIVLTYYSSDNTIRLKIKDDMIILNKEYQLTSMGLKPIVKEEVKNDVVPTTYSATFRNRTILYLDENGSVVHKVENVISVTYCRKKVGNTLAVLAWNANGTTSWIVFTPTKVTTIVVENSKWYLLNTQQVISRTNDKPQFVVYDLNGGKKTFYYDSNDYPTNLDVKDDVLINVNQRTITIYGQVNSTTCCT
jgi:hypothetical protein